MEENKELVEIISETLQPALKKHFEQGINAGFSAGLIRAYEKIKNASDIESAVKLLKDEANKARSRMGLSTVDTMEKEMLKENTNE